MPSTRPVENVAVFDYISTDQDELSISIGERLSIRKEDDGTGWTQVQKQDGSIGVVPTSYIKPLDCEKTLIDTPIACGVILYAYHQANDDELSVLVGESVDIVEKGSSLNLDDGSGWMLVNGKNGQGLVPSSYVLLK